MATKDSFRASIVNERVRSVGFKNTSLIISIASNTKLRLKYLPPFDNRCTIMVQAIGLKSSFTKRRKVDGVRGGFETFMHLLIAITYCPRYVSRKNLDKGGCQRSASVMVLEKTIAMVKTLKMMVQVKRW